MLVAYRLSTLYLVGDSITGAAAGLIAFLFLFGIVGVVGELPHLIQAGKFPR